MPISQSPNITTSAFPTETPPVAGQIPAADGNGGWVWVDNEGGSATTDLVNFITDIRRIGFVDITETAIPYLSGTENDTVNLDDAGSGWSYYFGGAKRTITGNKTVALTGGAGNAHADGRHYIYINTNDGTLKTKTSPFVFTDEVLVASVVWNQSLPSGSRSVIADERHSAEWDSSVHKYIHSAFGTQLISGGELSGYALLSQTDADKQYDISQAVIADEDLEHTLDALVGGNGQYAHFYRTSAGVWGWSLNNNFPYIFTASGRMNYDNATATGAEIPSGKYTNTYELLTNIEGQLRHLVVPSQFYYDTLPEAYAESFADLDLTGLSIPEYFIGHKLTWETSDALSGTGKCYIERVINYGGNPNDNTAEDVGAPALVEGATVGNFVSFVTTTGQQQDSGKNANSFVGRLFSKIVSTTITGSTTTAETSWVNVGDFGVSNLTLPANFLTIGKTIRIKFAGYLKTSGNSATITPVRIKYGSTILLETAVLNPDNNLSNAGFFGEVDITCRTIGVTGTVFSQGFFTRAANATTFTTDPMVSTTAVTVNTTTSNLIDIFGQYGQNTVGNNITMTNLTVEVL